MRYYLTALMLLGVAAPAAVLAQTNGPRLAAYESLAIPRTAAKVTFAKRVTQPGDRIDQQLVAQLDVESTVRKGLQTTETSKNSVGRRQRRSVLVDEVLDGRTVTARVHFSEYDRTKDSETLTQPVVGKTYSCHRLADETLEIKNVDGSLASPDEYELVTECMEALGRPNPLADYLHGRSITVGEKLDLPKEVGNALLSSDGSLGMVTKFQLTLTSVESEGKLANFKVEIESTGAETTQMKVDVLGQLQIETDTCRTRSMNLHGPLIMATTIGSYSAAETTFVRGKLKIETQASYSN